MHFGFTLDLSDIDLLSVDLLDQRYTHLDLFVSKTSWRRLQDMSSKTSWRCLQDVLRDAFKTSLQDVFKTSRKTRSYYAEDMLKTSSRHVLKTSSRPLEDQKMFAGFAFVS